MSPRTLSTALRESGVPAVDARLLMMHVTGLSRTALITHDHLPLSATQEYAWEALLARRRAGEPVAYLIGEREFFGLPLYTTPAVLIPRPETELLVETALEQAPHGARVLDAGTGSGAIAIALAHCRPDLHITALDCSSEALALATRNAERHLPAGRIRFVRSSWLAALGTQRFDFILSNPPYIRADDPHLQEGDVRFEPRLALTDEADGLNAYRILCRTAPAHLEPGGCIWFEHGYDQAQAVAALLHEHGFTALGARTDLAGILRITGGSWPAPL